MKRVIVTGANGFIGRALIEKLIKEKVHILAIDIVFQENSLWGNLYVTKMPIDLNDLSQLEKIPNDTYDAFYHLAWRGINGVDKADPMVQLMNIQMTIRCADIAKKRECKKFLCAGTIAEKAVNSLNVIKRASGGMMYGVAKHSTHLLLEAYCKNIGMDFIWMQFSNIYGVNNKTGNLVSYTLGELWKDKEAYFGPALQPYDFIFLEDLVEAVYRLGNVITSQNFYFIGSGKPRILKDYLMEIGELCNKKNLIKIGTYPDDGIVYTLDMFDTSLLIKEIGEYVTWSFTEGIIHIITKQGRNGEE